MKALITLTTGFFNPIKTGVIEIWSVMIVGHSKYSIGLSPQREINFIHDRTPIELILEIPDKLSCKGGLSDKSSEKSAFSSTTPSRKTTLPLREIFIVISGVFLQAKMSDNLGAKT
jgi:hypothetical protein